MRVMLIEPPKKVWDLMGDCVTPPLGLAWIAAVLEREEGVQVTVLDCNASEMGWRALRQAIEEQHPDLVGATAMTPYFPPVVRAMRIAKEVQPRTVTVLGGHHVTFLAEDALREHPEVDLVVCGEGERVVIDLVRALAAGRDLATVPGIAFRRNGLQAAAPSTMRDRGDDVQIVRTPAAEPVDLSALPLPAYHLLPMSVYRFEFLGNPFAVMQASRGCPHRCTFCSEWPFWGSWRARPAEAVVEEISLLSERYHCESVWFGDDCFNMDGEFMAAICEGILQRGVEINWFYQGRADLVVKHKELLPLMRRAGNRMTQIGIESSTEDELADLKKRLSLERVREAVELLKQHDIVGQGLLIIGTPTDSARSIQHKLRFAKWLDLDFPIFTVYTPFPGSDAYRDAVARGWLDRSLSYAHFDMAHVLLPTEHLSLRQVSNLYLWCLNSYYRDPIKVLRGMFSGGDWKRAVWRHLFSYNLKMQAKTAFRFAR
jgi:anaerobic magnesium-protoporphyrin IX monomethyl ester cyclase